MPHINDLPNEILRSIFSHAVRAETDFATWVILSKFATVSMLWCATAFEVRRGSCFDNAKVEDDRNRLSYRNIWRNGAQRKASKLQRHRVNRLLEGRCRTV